MVATHWRAKKGIAVGKGKLAKFTLSGKPLALEKSAGAKSS